MAMSEGEECSVCGNTYDKPLKITYNDRTAYYDCFECAVHALAPRCERCGLGIIGHGVEVDDTMFCCAHCARMDGKVGLFDRQPVEKPRASNI
jgi:hypothetical protein